MIVRVLVKSRRDIEDIISEKVKIPIPWSLISIYGTKQLICKEEEKTILNCQSVMSLKFSDVSRREYEDLKRIDKHESDKVTLFDESHAKQIIEFIDNDNKLLDHLLIVHCHAGISRSGAVGLFACRYLNLDEDLFREHHPDIQPNFYIYSTLYEISGMKNDYQKFWQETIPLWIRYDK